MRLLDQEARKEQGSLVTGYSRDYQVIGNRDDKGFSMNPYRRWSVTLCRRSLSTWRQHPWWWSAPPLHAPPCSPSTRTRESSPAAAAPVVQIPWKLVASHHRRWDLMIQRESFLFHFFLFCTETNHFMEGGCGLQDNCFIFQKHLLPPRLLCSFSSFFFQCILSQFVLLFEESSVLASSVLYTQWTKKYYYCATN